ncbi:hypothetical protein [Neorhizobium sp. DAR64872/K0K18]|uniref:hypothetical protein n=1 Tax=Neorhizobium sp. DAR64872/K0K18 TaxID=3421958 RepID=UPI003D2CECEE
MSSLPETALDRAKRLTQEQVDAGKLHSWVMGDCEQRDRFNQTRDRRAAFHVVDATEGSDDV